MYSRNEFDEYSIELHNVVQESLCGFFIGASLGGFIKSRDAYLHFIQNNQATIFHSTFEAKKKLQDYVTISFAKGAYHWGWRLGIFTGIFSLFVTSISVYRNRSSLSDYIVGGSLTGAIYKANLGPTAMLVGAGVGGVLSAMGGVLILGLLKISGLSMDDIRKSLYKIKETRQKLMDEAIEKSATEKNDHLTQHHDIIVKEKGVQKVEDLP
ncbi:hypothetical protein KGM_207571 [Danaus plexippus plexippus]|uniref:Complex I assembly factor TIMMDC1, mitochondrial n=1 Tax=Danaus plexippus plexippus TaxID=278856 RepID=A0A212FB14_DANPL|nr:hypothetical protein KGM_207571 [Danaus plexippus plexippus]